VAAKSTNTVVFADSDNGGIIHVANIKGGVGKSTVATNLAAALARRGPVLIIDLDVQGSASHALGQDPADFTLSSWDLFSRRFAVEAEAEAAHHIGGLKQRAADILRRAESSLFSQIVGQGDITSLAVRVQPCLDLIPANESLFRSVTGYNLRNCLYNLQICRLYYKYIILDTPSVWNKLTRALYSYCDLNLVPVTLNALSTRSLRDYLINVKRLAQKNANVRLRIVKNEVFGAKATTLKGKTRTMSENRRFLEGLCEQVVLKNENGISRLPQSILFDLEIPESATVRNAQDEGKPVLAYRHYSAVGKAFDELGKRVQYVLNNPLARTPQNFWSRHQNSVQLVAKLAAAVILIALFTYNKPVKHQPAPRPIAPQQIKTAPDNVLHHTFSKGESMHRMAKYAISYFRAKVPSMMELNDYVREIIEVHNRTRLPHEKKIPVSGHVDEGLTVAFYPPSRIQNPRERQLIPVYRYFMNLVSDSFSYVTGDWCERGTGGGQPHYGFDVAANLGSDIYAPINGTVVLSTKPAAGRTVGIVSGDMIVFFSHMDKRYHKTGDVVRTGEAIGTVGMTGVTSGPHVHIGYGIRIPSYRGGSRFGSRHYRLVDPKLFFYREQYLGAMENPAKSSANTER
jgi:cellulose biosynthesis protein BcsQ